MPPRRSAAEIGSAVRVLDSKFTGMNTGFIALAAARAAADGADLDTVVQAATAAVSRNHGFIVVHQLDNLRRSGRIGGAGAWLGTKLSLKPLLRIDDGKLVLAQRVRTANKAVATMIDRVSEIVGERSASLAVHHVANPDGARDLVAALAERLPVCEPAIVTDLGPVLALHVGAGALAVCLEVGEDVIRRPVRLIGQGVAARGCSAQLRHTQDSCLNSCRDAEGGKGGGQWRYNQHGEVRALRVSFWWGRARFRLPADMARPSARVEPYLNCEFT